ncbi:MAG: Fe-S cluster assembly protein SufD [Woeseiaceae bacterium]|nr:Fe-S cluster assembly protein SufD [Woeseiaceae bacterium]
MSKPDKLQSAAEQLGPDGLSDLRSRAAKKFGATGFPTTRMEDWKYTDLSIASDISVAALQDFRTDLPPSYEIPDIDAHWLVISNGSPQVGSFSAIDGVEVSLLSEADVDLQFNLPLSDLNLALLSDGLRLTVDSGVNIDKPIGILFFDDADTESLVSQGRVIIDVSKSASVQVIEFHATRGDARKYANVFVDLNIGDNARVDYARLQARDPSAVQTARLSVAAGRDATLRHFALDTGGKLVRNDLAIDIAQTGANVDFNGLYLADAMQHVDNHTRVDHRVGPAHSNQEYRGIVKGRAVWNGKAVVHEGADGTDAQQANHNLLVAERAEINAKPELEIYAEDVKCSHGTTVGQLDENAVFYLRTRCLDEEQARRLMTHAFAMGVAHRCPIDACTAWVDAHVDAALNALITEDAE